MLKILMQLAFPGALGFIFLTAFIIADKTFPEKILKITFHALLSGFALIITDSINYYFEAQNSHENLRLFMLALSFTFKLTCSSFCVSLSQRNNVKACKLLYLVAIVNGIISFVSIPTGCVFYIKPDATVGHGVLYFIPYIATIINCVVLFISGIKKFKTNRGETVISIAIITFPFIATLLEVKYGFMLMIPLAFITCVIFYFMCLNVQLYRRDTLTNLLNRRSFFMDAQRFGKKKMIILSMDLNNLKYYNDTFGHAAGDKAITTATHLMELAFSHSGIVYRTGGDEFMALFINKRKESVEDAITTFNLLLEKTEYRVACGISEYKPGDDFESIVAESDARMYKNKMAYKQRSIDEALRKNPEL